jgi:hypothetical protein
MIHGFINGTPHHRVSLLCNDESSDALNDIPAGITSATVYNLSLYSLCPIEGTEHGFDGCDLDVGLDACTKECLTAEHLYLDVRNGLGTGSLAQ